MNATEPRAAPGTALYVHVPFCVQLCTYCDFFSRVPDSVAEVDRAIDLLLLEAERRAPESPRTVFLGGGTPSYLDEDQLVRLLDGLEARTGFRGSAVEVTAECNPESLSPGRARLLVELGVRRLSVGVQSLRPEVLALFGRAHDAEAGLAALEAARAAGPEGVSADLIFGAPGVAPEAWLADLQRVLGAGTDHLSAYGLTYEEGTLLYRWREAGRIHAVDEDTELELFQATRRMLAGAGFEAYEISNFARPGARCLHNVNYWHNGPYVGLGPSAVSRVGPERFGNPRSVRRWGRALEAGRPAREGSERLSPRGRLAETWWLGLRLAEGLTPAEARERADFPDGAPDPFPDVAAALESEGWLERRASRFRLTEAGLPLADAVAARFLRGVDEPARTSGPPEVQSEPAWPPRRADDAPATPPGPPWRPRPA